MGAGGHRQGGRRSLPDRGGEPGAGRTAFLHEALAGAAALGCRVRYGAAEALGTGLPLRAALDCLHPAGPGRARALALLREARRSAEPGGALLAAVDLLAADVEEWCARRPMLLALDDLQWADPATLLLWRHLARAALRLPLLLVVARRNLPRRAEVEELCARLGGGPGGRTLRLEPLTGAESAALVREVLGADPGPRLREAAGQAGGNPRLLRELLAHWSGDIEVRGTGAELVVAPRELPPPPGSVLRELSRFHPAAVATLRHAALLGPSFTARELSLVRARPVRELLADLEEPLLTGVLEPSRLPAWAPEPEPDPGRPAPGPAGSRRPGAAGSGAGSAEPADGDALRFRQPAVRLALCAALPGAARTALHQDAARAFAGAGLDPARTAGQLLEGGALDPWAVLWTARSAQALIAVAPETAAALLRRAVDQSADQETDRAMGPASGRGMGRGMGRDVGQNMGRDSDSDSDSDSDQDTARDSGRDSGQDMSRDSGRDTGRAARRPDGRPGSPYREALEDGLADAALMLRRPESVELLGTLRERAEDPGRRAVLAFKLVSALMIQGDMARSLEVTEEALAEEVPCSGWRLRLEACRVLALADLRRPQEAYALAGPVVERARELGDPLCGAEAEHAMSFALFHLNRGRDSLRHVAAGIAHARRSPAANDMRLLLLANQAEGHLRFDEPQVSAAALAEARELAIRTGSTGRLVVTEALLADLRYRQGDWDAALAGLARARDMPVSDGWLPVLTHGLRALILGHRGEREAARAELAKLPPNAAAADGPPATRRHGPHVLLARALLAERDGRPGEALDALRPVLEDGVDEAVAFDRPWALSEAVRLALEAGDAGTARSAVAACARTAAALPEYPGPVLALLRCRGLFAQDPELLAGAVARARGGLVLGQTLEDLAVARAWHGDLPGSREALTRAVASYETLGARWDTARADARLRSLGVRRGSRAARRRPARGWEALTPAELKVALLVARGRTNPEIASALFLSRRTVQTHVSHILAKLEVRSRSEVAVLVAGQEGAQGPQGVVRTGFDRSDGYSERFGGLADAGSAEVDLQEYGPVIGAE